MPKLKALTLLTLLISCLNASLQAQSIKSSKKIAVKEKRVLALLQSVHSFYFNAEYNKAVYYADKAKVADPIVYAHNTRFDEIGLCRYYTKDYKGALHDFNKFLRGVDTHSYFSNKSYVLNAMIKIHTMFKQYDEAAKYSAMFGGLEKYQEALILCKQAQNKVLYCQLLDSALLDFKHQMDRSTKAQDDAQGYHKTELETFGYKYGIGFMLNYACLFIMSNQPAKALQIMQKRSINNFPELENSSEDLLAAFANYLTDTSSFNKVVIELKSNIEQHEKISPSMYRSNFGWFDQWILSSPFTPNQQEHLMTLNNIAKK